jgi:hypothetical protein
MENLDFENLSEYAFVPGGENVPLWESDNPVDLSDAIEGPLGLYVAYLESNNILNWEG